MGKGEKFFCEGSIIRKGNRIVVTRCDLKNEEGTLIALGTATYNIFSNPQDIPANVREAAEHILGEK
jgi:acyl-coenzyme A thioesterase PaaI-like protein